MQTLKHIVMNIHVVDGSDDPLFNIPSAFEDMRTQAQATNIIETVTIRISVRSCRRGSDWGRLDEVFTTSGWDSLKRVSLTIEISSYIGRSNELLRKLPEFRRLSSSNSVSFDFEVTVIKLKN